jgi:hypothetical protein
MLKAKSYHIKELATAGMIDLYAEDAYQVAANNHEALSFREDFKRFTRYEVNPRYDFAVVVQDLRGVLDDIAAARFDFSEVFDDEHEADELAPFGWLP